MGELIVQIFGMSFACLILFCIVWTFGDYIIEGIKLKKNK